MSGAAEAPHAPRGVTRLRVRYPETDRMGVAYHGHYLVWFELGRTELMRELGCDYGSLEDRDGVFFPVIEVGACYRVSARYDEEIEVRTRLARVGGVRVRFEYELIRLDGSKLLATGFTEHATVDRDGRPMRLPSALRARLGVAVARGDDAGDAKVDAKVDEDTP